MAEALQASSLEDRVAYLQRLVGEANASILNAYRHKLDLSWVYHDSALEGTVYSEQDLLFAFSDQPVADAALGPIIDEIRQHRNAVRLTREMAQKKRVVLSLDTIKNLYACLAPDEVEAKGAPKYRKDVPVHRLYFHDIAPPDKIVPRMRQFIEWLNDPEARRSMHVLRFAAKAQHQLMQIYPFPKHTGKVARLVMNLVMLHYGYPPAIIHSTERQRYYEALRGADSMSAPMVHEAVVNSIESAIRFFEGERQMRVTARNFRRKRAISG